MWRPFVTLLASPKIILIIAASWLMQSANIAAVVGMMTGKQQQHRQQDAIGHIWSDSIWPYMEMDKNNNIIEAQPTTTTTNSNNNENYHHQLSYPLVQELSCNESELEALLVLPRHFVTEPEFNDLKVDHTFDQRRCLMKRLKGRAEPTFVMHVTDLKMCGAHVHTFNETTSATTTVHQTKSESQATQLGDSGSSIVMAPLNVRRTIAIITLNIRFPLVEQLRTTDDAYATIVCKVIMSSKGIVDASLLTQTMTSLKQQQEPQRHHGRHSTVSSDPASTQLHRNNYWQQQQQNDKSSLPNKLMQQSNNSPINIDSDDKWLTTANNNNSAELPTTDITAEVVTAAASNSEPVFIEQLGQRGSAEANGQRASSSLVPVSRSRSGNVVEVKIHGTHGVEQQKQIYKSNNNNNKSGNLAGTTITSQLTWSNQMVRQSMFNCNASAHCTQLRQPLSPMSPAEQQQRRLSNDGDREQNDWLNNRLVLLATNETDAFDVEIKSKDRLLMLQALAVRSSGNNQNNQSINNNISEAGAGDTNIGQSSGTTISTEQAHMKTQTTTTTTTTGQERQRHDDQLLSADELPAIVVAVATNNSETIVTHSPPSLSSSSSSYLNHPVEERHSLMANAIVNGSSVDLALASKSDIVDDNNRHKLENNNKSSDNKQQQQKANGTHNSNMLLRRTNSLLGPANRVAKESKHLLLALIVSGHLILIPVSCLTLILLLLFFCTKQTKTVEIGQQQHQQRQTQIKPSYCLQYGLQQQQHQQQQRLTAGSNGQSGGRVSIATTTPEHHPRAYKFNTNVKPINKVTNIYVRYDRQSMIRLYTQTQAQTLISN